MASTFCFPRRCLLLAWLLTGPWLASAQDVHAVAEKVDQHYNRLHTLQAQFTETYSGAGATRTESGTLLLKKPGRMRWDYDQPRPKMFLTDGTTAWFYVPGEQQVRRASVKQLDDLRSPLRYLLGKTKLEKEFEGLKIAPGQAPSYEGDVVLEGVPRSVADRVTNTLLEVNSEGAIRRIVIDQMDGSTTEFRFLSQTENVQVPDERFRFTPPAGVTVLEGSELIGP